MDDLLKESCRLADYLMSACITSGGLLAKRIDLERQQPSRASAFNDLGDYAPFFYWLGRISGDKKYSDFAIRQADLAASAIKMSRFSSANEIADVALGFVLMHELTGRERYKAAADEFYGKLFRSFLGYNNFISAYSFRGIKSPFSFSGYTGMHIEELCRLYGLTKNREYILNALRLTRPWMEEKAFLREGIFYMHGWSYSGLLRPAFSIAGVGAKTAIMMKPNTNMVLGLMELYRATRKAGIANAVMKWMRAVMEKMMDGEGYFYLYYNRDTGEKKTISLEANHAAIDAMIEIYRTLGEREALEAATKATNSWLKLQSGQGLVRNSPEDVTEYISFTAGLPRRVRIPGRYSRLDSQTDFSIILLKMHELTGKAAYLRSADRLVKSMIVRHRLGGGYAEFVDTRSLARSGSSIDCKYLALLLKALLALHGVRRGKSIFKDKKFTNIIRDR